MNSVFTLIQSSSFCRQRIFFAEYHNCFVNFILGLKLTPENIKAFDYYNKNCLSIEIVKEDILQKVNFRVKNKVSTQLIGAR